MTEFSTKGEATPPSDKPAPKKGRVWRIALITVAALLVTGAAVAGFGSLYVWNTYLADTPQLPAREELSAIGRAPGIRFEDFEGKVIASRGARHGDPIRLADLPRHVPQAFLAAEDRRFYDHGPIDIHGITRAAWANFRAGRVVQGGSTITQQLAKGLFLTPQQTIERKLQEMLMAHRLEQMLSKDEVLQLYLNRIYFGANTFGVDGAARTYFGKPASELTLAEAALLASLPKAPSRLALTRDFDGALRRSHLILANMAEEGWIGPAEYAAARASVPELAAGAWAEEGDIGYVLDAATAEAVKIAGPGAPDLVVRLTIDPRLQKAAAETVQQVLATDGANARASQAALVALAPDGAIRAMVGGRDYDDSSFNRATQARRQPGSTFKPFVYAAAIEAGMAPTDVRVDEPIRIGDWEPGNYGGNFLGPVTLTDALARSINTVAVKVAQEVGAPAVGGLARRFGLSSIPERPDLSVALGAYETTLLDLASAFQVFERQGQRIPPYLVTSVRTVGGTELYERQPIAPAPVYDVTNASMMVRMLQTVVTGGTGARAALADRPSAGKTGTSQNWRDAWFVGFTPDFTAGVWVGNDNDKPMAQVAGGGLPATIWNRFMTAAHQGLPPRDFDWLQPDPVFEDIPDVRNGFYQALAQDFGAVAGLPVNPPELALPPLPPAAPAAPEPL